jgi:hypothetical protein
MDLFNEITGGVAIIRKAPGILKQVPIYSRKSHVYIKELGGFIRVCERLSKNEPYLTIHPNYKVIELEGEWLVLDGNKAPRYG